MGSEQATSERAASSSIRAGVEFPHRYIPMTRLGSGGAGEVWEVEDRYTKARLALKILSPQAGPAEASSLIKEAVALSGLEGLGVPRVLRFGKLPTSGRLYLLRELVEGESLQSCAETGSARASLLALAGAADKLTRLHRADLLHGDIKPANIIVSSSGEANLVDLGLAAPFREGGTKAGGLTPKYAAPELLLGHPLTVRSEIHALGIALQDLLENEASAEELSTEELAQLQAVQRRAAHHDPASRYPSADEFAAALRGALSLRSPSVVPAGVSVWPVTGIEALATRLFDQATELAPGQVLRLNGPQGSGRTLLLRRLAWSLGIEEYPLVWLDADIVDDDVAVAEELGATRSLSDAFVLVDDPERMSKASVQQIAAALKHGCRLVVTWTDGTTPAEHLHFLTGATAFQVPPLSHEVARELTLRSVPSLTDSVVQRILLACDRRPGPLKRMLSRLESASIVSAQDVDQLLADTEEETAAQRPSLEHAINLLDRGRFTDAARALEPFQSDSSLQAVVARARLLVGLGEGQEALDLLLEHRDSAEKDKGTESYLRYQLWVARAYVGVLDHVAALELLEELIHDTTALGAEALVYYGLSLSRAGEQEKARATLLESVERARQCGSDRVEGMALLCAGTAHLHAKLNDDAEQLYRQALAAAERASDASTLANARSNLGVLFRMRGDLAGALENYEAAIDAGRRSGRLRIVRLSLANLANTDLYLGRLERAQSSIEELENQWDQLGPGGQAQLLGLRADLFDDQGKTSEAMEAYRACAQSYLDLNQEEDAAEARLWALLIAPRESQADLETLRSELQRSLVDLGTSRKHLPLARLAEARLARIASDEDLAQQRMTEALEEARATEQSEWVWRALAARAELQEERGQWLTARRDREAALLVLEEIAAPLPRDLREVYWNDKRRRQLQLSLQASPGAIADPALAATLATNVSGGVTSISEMGKTPLERRLARILEINSELLGEFDLNRLAARVIACAAELLDAERGFVILQEDDGELRVHSSADQRGDKVHAEFSRSIAQKVLANRKPVVSLDARQDDSMRGYASVHQLMLQAVACVPINGRERMPIGALYLETRLQPGRKFQSELPTLQAFADQVGLAIATAKLINENVQRAAELQKTNERLESAQERLRELLGERTQKLRAARRRLRDARDTLYGHFGYQGLVGTSAAMRRVYSLIDRVKDTDVPVLVHGESGTGKEGACRAVHQASERSKRPFLGINCGAIPEHLLESELFGHVRGAFTGADKERKGLIREAGDGTVLLDEIGEMPAKMQASLLRVLQERKVRPVGANTESPVECRFLFATHRDLSQMVEQGAFRADLYYRIMVVEIRIPPLRDHLDDIPLLVDHFLGLFSARYKRERKTLTRAALKRLSSYHWPGNVRQLEHVLLNAWVLSDQPEIDDVDLELPHGSQLHSSFGSSALKPSAVQHTAPQHTAAGAEPPPVEPAPRDAAKRKTLSAHLEDEKSRITEALASCNWNRVKAAESLGMPRRTFYRRLKQYGIQ